MKPVFLFLLLGISAQADIHAQKISLHPDLFKKAHKSLLILSDDDGEVFTAEVIDSAAITDVYTLQAPPESRGQKMHFTIINEFHFTGPKKISSFFYRAYTFYKIPDSIYIENIPEVAKYWIKPLKTITILLDGITSVESVTALSPHQTMTRYHNKNTNTLEIRIETLYDLVIVLNCNGEEKPRWLEIHDVLEDAGLIEFEMLPIGVKPIEITFPEKADWGIVVRENSPEGYRLVQEFNMSGTIEQDKYPVILSENIPTNQYRIRAAKYTDKKQNSRLFYEWNMQDISQMPKVDVSDFKYKFTSNSDGFVIKGKGKSAQQQQCRINYISRWTNGTDSDWTVAGALFPEMKFTFPNIPNHIKEQMATSVGGYPFIPYNAQIIREFENGNRVYIEEGVH